MKRLRHEKKTGWLLILMLLAMALWPALRASALPIVAGAGFIKEEGEYLSDQGWDNDDTINVASEIITSGGTVTFQMVYLGLKYGVATFFGTAVKPTEFWLNFLQRWRYQTDQRAPEDFRMMTGMMLARRADISWLQVKCADLTQQEGWNNIFPSPWAVRDESAAVKDFDGGFVGRGDGADPTPALPSTPTGGSVTAISTEHLSLECKNSKNFEEIVNQLAKDGDLEKELGIPKNSTYLNLSYHGGEKGAEAAEKMAGGVNGVDGFFVTQEGKCHLLEMKWYNSGGAKLGQIEAGGVKITQTSPEWLHKALFRIKGEDADRFAAIAEKVEGTRFGKFMEMTDFLHTNKAAIAAELNIKESQIENFTHFDELVTIIKRERPELGENIAGFIAEDLHVGIVMKKAGNVKNVEEVTASFARWAKAFGTEAVDVAEHVAVAGID